MSTRLSRRSETGRSARHRLRSALGEARPNFVYEPLRDANGDVEYIFVHAVEVTDLVHARQAARDDAQLVETLHRVGSILAAELRDSVHVLVVEDEPAMREMLQRALEDEGIQVVVAIDGLEGIKFATTRRPASLYWI